MKKFLVMCLLIGSSATLAQASDSVMFQDQQLNIIEGYRMRPCGFWSRDRDSMGWVCSSLDMYINVPTVSEVQDVIDQLVAKIRELESRVQKLENP